MTRDDRASYSGNAYHPLLERIAAGDEDALMQLYAEYRPRLWRYVWQQVGGDRELAEEVLQDVFLAIWHGVGTFAHRATLSTWIFRIAHNIAASSRHTRRRQGEWLSERSERLHAAPHGNPEDEVLERLTLVDALAHLSAKHREVLELMCYHGFTCEEAGQILDVPVGTVKSRMNHARKALADQLGQPGQLASAGMSRIPVNDALTLPSEKSLPAGEAHHDA
jgi:RNA polymerase sigma-70 factor, ECF subfamily